MHEPNKRWFICASGPSLTQEDVDSLKGQNVIVINTTYKLAKWAKVLYACDPRWWRWNEGAKDFEGERWTQFSGMGKEGKLENYIEQNGLSEFDLNYIRSVPNSGISEDSDYIYQGSNSGIQAINLAYHFGARSICLLGYDLQATGGKNHWHEDPEVDQAKWSKWIPLFDRVAEDAKKLGIPIVNCTRETALTQFDRKNIDEILGGKK